MAEAEQKTLPKGNNNLLIHLYIRKYQRFRRLPTSAQAENTAFAPCENMNNHRIIIKANPAGLPALDMMRLFARLAEFKLDFICKRLNLGARIAGYKHKIIRQHGNIANFYSRDIFALLLSAALTAIFTISKDSIYSLLYLLSKR